MGHSFKKDERKFILSKGEEEVGQAGHLLGSPERLAKQSLHTCRIRLHLASASSFVDIIGMAECDISSYVYLVSQPMLRPKDHP